MPVEWGDSLLFLGGTMALRRRTRRRLKIAAFLLTCLVLLGAGVSAMFIAGNRQPPPVSESVAEYVASPPTLAPDPKAMPIGDSLALLDDPARTFTIGVLGDSTGNASDEWVYMAAYKLAAAYDRPAIIHDWSTETNTYVAESPIIEGEGAPIIVWNGSGPGKNTDYSMEFVDTMIPERPDLLIINHGHNLSSSGQAISGIADIVRWAFNTWDEPPAVALTLQNPRTDEQAERQDSIVRALRLHWGESSLALIDAHTAYIESGDLPALLREDGLHPNVEGSEVWAEAAMKVLLPQ